MIVQLTGKILELDLGRLVVDVSGVGYEVSVPTRQFLSHKVGDSITVLTALIIREDAHILFGFEDSFSKKLFSQLHSVSGVGPKSAMAVLSHWEPQVIASAIAEGTDAVFSAVSGIGPKTAKLICVTLAGKVSIIETGANAQLDRAVEGLMSLGWSELAASKAAKAALEHNASLTAAEILKTALASKSSAKLAE